nr:RNA-directed DNA polymerase, eukaryota [Tanacetum cinerariifolium]
MAQICERLLLKKMGMEKEHDNGGGKVNEVEEEMKMKEQLSFSVEPYSALDQLQRWEWSLSGDGEFYVSSAITLIDDRTFGMVGSKNQWCKFVPLKVNIHSWRVKLNNLTTRLNLSRRGFILPNMLDRWEWSLSEHGEFYVSSAITLIDDKTFGMVGSKNQWYWWSWLSSLRLSSKLKMVLQGFLTSLGGHFGSTGIKPSLVLITCQKLDYLTIFLLIRLHGVDLEVSHVLVG